MIGRMASVLVVALGILSAWPAEAQNVAVDRVMRLLADNMVQPGGTIISAVVESDWYSLAASGRHVTVTTRFLREASPQAWAAAAARDLLPDPVEFAVVLERAGFDGPRGLRELRDRVAWLVAWEVQARTAANGAYRQWRAEIDANSFNAVSRPGYELIYAARRDALRARYEQRRREYQAVLAGLPQAYAMQMVAPEFLSAVTEVTAVLWRTIPIELSPWEPRIREVLDEYDRARR